MQTASSLKIHTSTRKRLACAYCTPYNALLKSTKPDNSFQSSIHFHSALHSNLAGLFLIIPSTPLPRTRVICLSELRSFLVRLCRACRLISIVVVAVLVLRRLVISRMVLIAMAFVIVCVNDCTMVVVRVGIGGSSPASIVGWEHCVILGCSGSVC